MTPENFCYWLQGFLELQKPQTMAEWQVDEIAKHLKSVFENKTQIYSPASHAAKPIEPLDLIC